MDDGTVDKDKFKAAVFRRGNKQELLHPSTSGKHEGATVPDQLTGDEKLDELLHLWSLSRSGKDLSAAIWRPSKCAAQVVIQKGRLFSHVGSFWGGHLYLTIEEAVYMVDRGSMLLFQEDGRTKRLLTMKECYALMESCGVSMDHFITYCKLLRAGYVAHRRGLPWVVKNKEEVQRCDCRFQETRILQKHKVINGGDRKRPLVPESVPVGKKQQKERREDASQAGGLRMGEWWPEYQWHDEDAGKNLPTCDVIDEETKAQRRLGMFPRLKPLASHVCVQHHDDVKGSDQGMYLDVYPPNGTFSRKQPGPTCALLSMVSCGEDAPPSNEILEELEPLASSSDGSIRFVGVEHGDIAFYSFFRTTLRDIH